MSDRTLLALLALFATVMIGLAAVWPQGLGARSPGPFGHPPLEQTPAMQAAIARANAKVQRQAQAAATAKAAANQLAAQPAVATPAPAAQPAGLRPGL